MPRPSPRRSRGRAGAAAGALLLLALLSAALSAARAARYEHSPLFAGGRLGGRQKIGDDDAAAQPAAWRFGASSSKKSKISVDTSTEQTKKGGLGSLFSVSFKDDDEPSNGGSGSGSSGAKAAASRPRSSSTAPTATTTGGKGLFGGFFKREAEQLASAQAAAKPLRPLASSASPSLSSGGRAAAPLQPSAFAAPPAPAAAQTEMIVRRIMVPGVNGEPPKERIVVVRRPVAAGTAAPSATALPSAALSSSDDNLLLKQQKAAELQKLRQKQQQQQQMLKLQREKAAAEAAQKAAEEEAGKNADPNVKKIGITLSLDELARRAKAKAAAASAAALAAEKQRASGPIQPLVAYAPPSAALVEAAKQKAAERRESEKNDIPNIDELLGALDALDRAKTGAATGTDPLLIASTGAKLVALLPKEGASWTPGELRDLLKKASTDALGGRDADKIARLQSKLAEYAEPLLKSASNITGVDVTGLTAAFKNAADLAPAVDKLLAGSVSAGGRDYFASLVTAADAVGGKFVMPALGKLQDSVAGKNDTVSKIVATVIGDGKEKTEEERRQAAEAARKARAGARLSSGASAADDKEEAEKKGKAWGGGKKGGGKKGGGRGARRAGTLAATIAGSDDYADDASADETTPLQKFAKLVIMHQGGAGAAALEGSTLGKLAGFGPTEQDKQVRSALEAAAAAAAADRENAQSTAGESKRFEKALGAMVTQAAKDKKEGEEEYEDGGPLPGARQAARGDNDNSEEASSSSSSSSSSGKANDKRQMKKLDSSDFLYAKVDPNALNDLLGQLGAQQQEQLEGGPIVTGGAGDVDASGKKKKHGGGLAALSDPETARALAGMGLGADALSAYGAESGSMSHLKAIAAKAAAAPPPPPPSRVAQVLASMVGNYTVAVNPGGAGLMSAASRKKGGRASIRLNNGKGAVVPPLGTVLWKAFPSFSSVAALPADAQEGPAAASSSLAVMSSAAGNASSSSTDDWLGGLTDVYYQRDTDRMYALAGDGPERGAKSWFARVHRWDAVGEDPGEAMRLRPPTATIHLTLPAGVALLGPSASGAVAELMDAEEAAAMAAKSKNNNATTATTTTMAAPAAAATAVKAPAAASAAAPSKTPTPAVPAAKKAAVRRRVMLEVSASVTAAAVSKAQQAQAAAAQARAQQQQGLSAAIAAANTTNANASIVPDRSAVKAAGAIAAAEAAAKSAAERRTIAKAKAAAAAAALAARPENNGAAATTTTTAATKPGDHNTADDIPVPVYTAARVASVFGMAPDANATRGFDTIDPALAPWGGGNINSKNSKDDSKANAASRLGLSLSPAGLAVSRTGVLYVGDAYGPAIYAFGPDGSFMRALDVPEELLPRSSRSKNATTGGAGVFDFSSRLLAADNDDAAADETATRSGDAQLSAGRQPRRGFGALAFTPGDNSLLAVMAGPLVSDGGYKGAAVRVVRFSPYTGAAVAQHAFNLDSVSELNAKASDYNFVLQQPRPRELSQLPPGYQGRALQVTGIVAANETHWMVLETDARGYGPDDPAVNSMPVAKRISIVDSGDASDVSGVASLPYRLPVPLVKRDRKSDEWYVAVPEGAAHVAMRKVLYMDVLEQMRGINAQRQKALDDREAKARELSLPPLTDSELAAFKPIPIAAEWSGMTAGPPQDGEEGSIAEMRLIVVTNNRFGRLSPALAAEAAGGASGGKSAVAAAPVMCAAPYSEPAVNWDFAREISGSSGDAEDVARALEPGKRSQEDQKVLEGMKEANVTSWGEAFKQAGAAMAGKALGRGGGGGGGASSGDAVGEAAAGANGTAVSNGAGSVTMRAAMAAQSLLATEDVVRAYEVDKAAREAKEAREASAAAVAAAKAAKAAAMAASKGANATAPAGKAANATAAPPKAAANATTATTAAASSKDVTTATTKTAPKPTPEEPQLYALVAPGTPCPAGLKPVPTYVYTLSTQGGQPPAASVTDAVFQRQSKNLKRGSAASGLLSVAGSSSWGREDAAMAAQDAAQGAAAPAPPPSRKSRKSGARDMDDFAMGDDDV